MEKLTVGIIFGGKSAEHEVSLQSAKNIVDAIDRTKFNILLIGIDKEGNWNQYKESSYLVNEDDPKKISLHEINKPISLSLDQLTKKNGVLSEVDVVFPIIHGTLGEDGSLQGMLEMLDLPYVGPNVLSSSICMDKDIAKKLLQLSGIKVAKGIVVTRNDKSSLRYEEVEKELGSTLFIKPANQGSSVGVSKVSSEEEFIKGIEEAFLYDHKLVIEEAIKGREIEISVLGNEEPMASLPGEILPKTEFYSYESKYIDEKGAKLDMPAKVSDSLTKRLQAEAVKAFKALQCEGLARVDFFVTEDEEIYVNELNTLPGFTKISMYPQLWEISGIPYTELITRLLKLAIERHERNKKLRSSVYG